MVVMVKALHDCESLVSAHSTLQLKLHQVSGNAYAEDTIVLTRQQSPCGECKPTPAFHQRMGRAFTAVNQAYCKHADLKRGGGESS